jgi:hypothetical protein
LFKVGVTKLNGFSKYISTFQNTLAQHTQVQSIEIFLEKQSSFKTQVQSTEIITRKIGFQKCKQHTDTLKNISTTKKMLTNPVR